MRGVFLDRSTFSSDLILPAPESLSEWQVYDHTPHDDKNLIIKRLQDVEVAVVNKVPLPEDILRQLPRLRLVQLTATGMNNIDLNAAKNLRVVVKNVEGYSIHAVPEHTFALMLAWMRSLFYYRQAVFDGSWRESACFCMLEEPIVDLAGKTLGIIGFGQIGRRVADIAKAFAMKVMPAEHRGCKPRSADYFPFDEVLAHADVLTLHCPLNADTEHLIDKDTLSLMKKKPLLMNLARGGVVNKEAVVWALNENRISGYAADVLAEEPPSSTHPLMHFAHDYRVLLTPHNAWGSHDAQLRMWRIVCKQIDQFIKEFGDGD